MTTNRFLSSGVYGCVYYPSYNCSGIPINNNNTVTKLVKYDFTSKTEIKIGQILKNYKNNFVLIENSCKIQKDNLQKSDMTPKCKLLAKDRELKKQYILLYSKYIKSKELADYLDNSSFNTIIKTYIELCKRIDIMVHKGIIHHDLHFGNILIGENGQSYVIDFGLSMIKSFFFKNNKLNYPYLKESIFSYSPTWKYWSLEYHFVCFLINEGNVLTPTIISYTIDKYLSEHKIIKKLGSNYAEQFKLTTNKFFNKFVNKNKEDVIRALFDYSDTWDFYKIALHYMDICNEMNITKTPFYLLLIILIHPNPEFRPTPLEIKLLNDIIVRNYEPSERKVSFISKSLSKELKNPIDVKKSFEFK
jgi:serine/threonine protein kinase